MQSKEKVSVFISSRCDSDEDKKNGIVKYEIIRKALKSLLLESGLCKVYVFEDYNATSFSVGHSYTDKFDDADLIIFIIDNKDGASDAILEGISRAKAHQKRSMYFFCDEFEKSATSIQEDLVTNTKNPKYRVISKYADIAEYAYKDVIDEIVEIYVSYCKGRINYIEDDSIIRDKKFDIKVADDTSLTKEFIKGFDYTRRVIQNIVKFSFVKAINPAEQDKNCASLLRFVLGEVGIETVDFSAIKRDINSYHCGNIQKVVKVRYEAVEFYFNGRLAECVEKLGECIEECKKYKDIPKWFYNDIAIDMRNIQIVLDKEQNIISFDSKGQQLLNKNDELLYYPLIDRVVSEHNELIYKELMKNEMKSTFAMNISNMHHIIENVCNSFVVAYVYGSITHMLLIRKRIYDYLIALSFEFRNHSMFMLCVKLLVLSGENKELKKYILSYGENTNNINKQDARKLLDSVSYQTIRVQRIVSRALLLQHFGYYYSDEDFYSEYESLVDEVKECINDNYAVTTVVKPLLEAYCNILFRINENDILHFVYFLFDNNHRMYYNDAFKLLSQLQFEKVSESDQIKYRDFLIKCLEDKEICNGANDLFSAARKLRQVENVDHSKLDYYIKNNYSSLYSDSYRIDTGIIDDSLGWSLVKKYIKKVRSDNSTQGKNGAYYNSVINPYISIGKIICKSNFELKRNRLKALIDALRETLLEDLQTIDAKVNAMWLLCLIQLRFPKNKQVKSLVEEISNDKDMVLKAKELVLLKGYSGVNLKFLYVILQIILKNDCEENISRLLIGIQNEEIAVRVITMKKIESLAEYGFFDCCVGSVKALLFQYILSESYNANSELKFSAMANLTRMIKGAYRKQCLDRFIEMMDYESYMIKVGLLYRLSEEDKNDSKIKYIFEKGKNDSHFWIRHVSNKVMNDNK